VDAELHGQLVRESPCVTRFCPRREDGDIQGAVGGGSMCNQHLGFDTGAGDLKHRAAPVVSCGERRREEFVAQLHHKRCDGDGGHSCGHRREPDGAPQGAPCCGACPAVNDRLILPRHSHRCLPRCGNASGRRCTVPAPQRASRVSSDGQIRDSYRPGTGNGLTGSESCRAPWFHLEPK
jgi:hypothetical protein